MQPFVKTIARLITGQKAIDLMTLHWVWLPYVISAAASVAGGALASSANKKAGAAASEAAYANAADLRELSGLNADAYMRAGAINAGATVEIGELNAGYIERAGARNMMLYGIQADEEIRRHIRAEKNNAGAIRARASGSGIQVNTGSPLAYLNAQIEEGLTQRFFTENKHYQTLMSMKMDTDDRAFVTRFTAGKQAEVIMANAGISAEMALANAEMQATAMERGGQTAQSTYNAQASAAMWGGVLNAAGTVAGGFASGAFSLPSAGTGMSAPPGIAASTPPPLLTAPGYMGAPSPYSGSLLGQFV